MSQLTLQESDEALARFFISDMYRLGSVLRWRTGEDLKFRSLEDWQSMKEDLLQHGAAMAIMHNMIRLQAEYEGDDSVTGLDQRMINAMILYHDHAEILAGDIKHKTADYRQREEKARRIIRQRVTYLPPELCAFLHEAEAVYEEKNEPWTWYVKALDEMQAWTYLLFLNRVDEARRVFENLDENKGYQLAQHFPILQRLSQVLLRLMYEAREKQNSAPQGF